MSAVAASPSRRPVTVPSVDRHLGGKVTCGQPSRSASIAGTTPMVPSVEAMPQMTRSCRSSRSPWPAPARCRARRCRGSRRPRRGRALSAPIGRRLAQRVLGLLGPDRQHGDLGVVAAASAICSACSTAYSSSSDSSPSTSSRSTVWSSAKFRSPGRRARTSHRQRSSCGLFYDVNGGGDGGRVVHPRSRIRPPQSRSDVTPNTPRRSALVRPYLIV